MFAFALVGLAGFGLGAGTLGFTLGFGFALALVVSVAIAAGIVAGTVAVAGGALFAFLCGFAAAGGLFGVRLWLLGFAGS